MTERHFVWRLRVREIAQVGSVKERTLKEESNRRCSWASTKMEEGGHAVVSGPDPATAPNAMPSGDVRRRNPYGVRTGTPFAGGDDTSALLVRVAERLASTDSQLAREVYLQALGLKVSTERLGGPDSTAVAEAARSAPPPPSSPRAPDLLLDGLVTRVIDGYAAGVSPLRRALRAFADAGETDETGQWRWLVLRLSMDLWDEEPGHAVISEECGLLSGGAELTIVNHSARGGREMTPFALAVLENGLGRYPQALSAAQRAADCDELGLSGWALSELVEAGVRSRRCDVAHSALVLLSERTQASATEWALGIEARSRALVSEGPAADAFYREAIDRLDRTRVTGPLARSHLLYGEWLRRQNRRVEAREELRLAHDMLVALGAEAFAERARRELLATGETVRKRTGATFFDLTAQEEQIARLAGNGFTNPEIATQFFISARTVEWHLRKVFSKLGVASRRELPGALLQWAPR
jgi:DNA-binding CsgD family transcriptional regulator